MSRRPASASPPPAKRIKLEEHAPLTPEDYKNGIVLAPMVRSGALPTRLFALKHGASLVWGPEIVDKAILHAERVIDPNTGLISYNGKSRAIFATHPIEKPYLIYQIGSSSPELAVQAALKVLPDVSGIDLNCGCPKPFSTHSGMGAALLTDPDVLCGILTALRAALPSHISVSAKIRLLPNQQDTLKLVERIVNTGINCLTVHCRTRNMREKDPATIERLREIVEFVEGMGKGIAVIENGDCLGAYDVKRVKDVTGAHSVMIARGAESNPSCFSLTPLTDIHQTLVPPYLRVCKYLDNHWALTKFCVSQFKGSFTASNKHEEKKVRETIVRAKGYDDVKDIVGDWTGEKDFMEICEIIGKRPVRIRKTKELEASNTSASTATTQDALFKATADTPPEATSENPTTTEKEAEAITPPNTTNPHPPSSRAPHIPETGPRFLPAAVTGQDPLTPTPGSIPGTPLA